MPSIPSIVTDTNITFFAQGQAWSLTSDHPFFPTIQAMLERDEQDENKFIAVVDPATAVLNFSGGRVILADYGSTAYRDGTPVPHGWVPALIDNPSVAVALLPAPGDAVTVEGDEDCPDGTYTVADVDDTDSKQRIYLETEEGFFGFVANRSIKRFDRCQT